MSELRQDPVSGEWVIIAPGRAARPKFLDAKHPLRKSSPKRDCPFEYPEKAGDGKIISIWPDRKHWEILVVGNKYPAVAHDNACAVGFHTGVYYAKTGIGSHELIITRDHNKNFADISTNLAAGVLQTMQDRYHAAIADGCSEYVVPFFNWGPTAGASVWHPHYQVLTLPAVPTHTMVSLEKAKKYKNKHGSCLRCDIIKAERKWGIRVIAENKLAIALAPYASKLPFEVMVVPKTHTSYFRDAGRDILQDIGAMIQTVMKLLRRNANDPDLNVFIHDAPLGPKQYEYHHWHLEILPRISIPAGFEFSTGMYVDQMVPEKAAAILRGEKE